MTWDILAFVALGIIISILFLLTIIYRQKYIRLIRVIAQLILDKDAIAQKLDEQMIMNSKEVNDGFIKFLSESREAAFNYIEDIQKSVYEYMKAIESNDNDKILTARMELFAHLPDNMEDENQNKQ